MPSIAKCTSVEVYNVLFDGWQPSLAKCSSIPLPGSSLRVKTLFKARLAAGAAAAGALGVTRQEGEVTDTRQWCKDGGIDLVAGQ